MSAVAAGCFYSKELVISCATHGDDFIAEGLPASLDKPGELLSSSTDVKCMPRVGPEAGVLGRYLQRIIRWAGAGFSWQADPKRVHTIIELLVLEGAKPVDAPGNRTTGVGTRDALDPLVGQELKLFPQVAGLVRYLGPW